MYIKRHIEKVIERARKEYPSLLITGARQVGKSTVLREMYPDYAYETMDDLAINAAVQSDPLGYLRMQGTPFIIDEVQKVPDLFGSLKYVIDKERKVGQYLLTGSQKFNLMKGASESLAGRVAVIELLGLSMREKFADEWDVPFLPVKEYLFKHPFSRLLSPDMLWNIIHRGSMPALSENEDRDWARYYADYVSTYIERDVRQLIKVGDTLTFMQFLVALAGRTGEILNMDSLARDVGVSAPTIKKWISVLQASNIIYLLQPFSLNAAKRVIKTPKVYFTDTGLVCYLCKWLTKETLMNGAQAGAIFETFVVSEIMKSYYNAGMEPPIYYFRSKDGQEIDLLFWQNGTLYPVEIKKTASPNVKDIKHFSALKDCFPTQQIGEGGIICRVERLLPLGLENVAIPVEYL